MNQRKTGQRGKSPAARSASAKVGRSKSSAKWLQEHFDDPYVKQAQKEGYRSRASYKLLELQEKDRLIRPGMTVVDLGAAPGGWSQVAVNLVGHKGRVIASDILAMDGIAGVTFIEGDFTEQAVFDRILVALDHQKADVVISDMAPNMSGTPEVDQPRGMELAELAVDLAGQVLKPDGVFVSKLFQGEGFDALVAQLRKQYKNIKVRKPPASRSRSREVYLVATGFKA
jgi:23S rRNA (uridine2552-2'-O)-methyltransferase